MERWDIEHVSRIRTWIDGPDAWKGDTQRTSYVSFLLRVVDKLINGQTLIQYGEFRSHSGVLLPYKIDCDALSDGTLEGIAQVIASKFRFGEVIGIPRGGLRLATALADHSIPGYPPIVVDDVMTTGGSMEETRAKLPEPEKVNGIVIFNRSPSPPSWVWSNFTVNGWTQSLGKGLG